MNSTTKKFTAGAAQVDISPQRSLPLAGYPFVERNSTGVYDPLFSTAIYINDGDTSTIFIGNDLIFVSKSMVTKLRTLIERATGVPASNILISATHTHSGPAMVRFAAGGHDSTLANPDTDYLHQVEEAIVEVASLAKKQAVDVKIELSIADATGIGSNRQDPVGPSDLNVPVLCIKAAKDEQVLALMAIVSMHPTVLREDSKIVSGDFPGIARQILQREILQKSCPVLFHIGAAGDQSPRHVTRANTLSEAERLARILAKAISNSLNKTQAAAGCSIRVKQYSVELLKKVFPTEQQIARQVQESSDSLKKLKERAASKQEIRLAEVNWFGAVELAHLQKLSASGLLDEVYASCSPAEVQVIKIAQWIFVGWPGEIFIDYALQIKKAHHNAFVITLANGELQGYIVTKAAAEKGGYEASNAIFDYKSGDELVITTLRALTN